jgi:hypothetical protein
MTRLYLSFTDFVYVRLTAIVWVSNGLVYISNLQKAAADCLQSLYENLETEKPIIIDCRGISNVIDHSWDGIFTATKQLKRNIYFTHSLSLQEKISSAYKEFCNVSDCTLNVWNHTTSLTHGSGGEFKTVWLTEIDRRLHEVSKKYILDSFCPHEKGEFKLLSSTPFYANGEYTANKLLINRDIFIWLVIIFADYIQAEIERHQIGKTIGYPLKFLSVSLRSAPFASAVSQLLNFQLRTIEFLGPRRNSLNPRLTERTKQYEYLYIGDFSFAGTEIRITQMFAQMNHGKLKHAFVLGSLFSHDRFSDIHLHALVDLNENKSAKYELFKIQK